MDTSQSFHSLPSDAELIAAWADVMGNGVISAVSNSVISNSAQPHSAPSDNDYLKRVENNTAWFFDVLDKIDETSLA